MASLAQYYTHSNFSELLLSSLSDRKPENLLELGFGAGALTKAAIKRWGNIPLIGCDLDELHVLNLLSAFPASKVYVENGLSNGLHEKLNLKIASIDVAICNPPYLKIGKTHGYAELIKAAGMGDIASYRFLTSDLIFLAQNLLLLKTGGELGIILPDGLFTSIEFRAFRKELFFNHTVTSVIQLPRRIFKSTDALTHILILKKGMTVDSYDVKLCLSDENGRITNFKYIKNHNLVERADYSFHSASLNPNSRSVGTLGELGVDIYRGKRSKKRLQSTGKPYLHIPDVNTLRKISFPTFEADCDVQAGDFAMIRVGRNGIGKVSEIISGSGLISDCLFTIRAPEEYRKLILENLRSNFGLRWFEAYSKGVAAKVLSKSDLLNFPIFQHPFE